MFLLRQRTTKFALFKNTDLWYFIIFCSLFLFLFRDFFFKANTFYERDITLLEIPLRKHAAELLKQGNFALWTDAHGNGQPFLANPKTAIFYPTTWLYLILPFFVAFKIHYLIHPLIGWLGMYFLTATYGLSKKASFLASSLFFFSGIYLSSFEFYNHIAAIAWMMWVLYFHRLNPQIKSLKFLLNIFTWVLLILSGAPEFIIITGALALAQCFIDSKKFKENFIRLAIAVILACLISAAQLMPALEMLSQTDRTSQAEIWPLELIQLLNLVFPGILGDDRSPGRNDFWGGHLFNTWYPLYYSFYLGFGAIILFILSLLFPKRKEEKILAISAFIFFLISCGKYSPFFLIYRSMPLISSIRFPVKYIVGTFFCLCLMAGFSLDKLSMQPINRIFSRILLLISLICCLIFLLFRSSLLSWFYNLFVIDNLSSKRNLAVSLTTGLVAFLFYSIYLNLIKYVNQLKPLLAIILILACLADPLYHNRYINPTVPESFFKNPEILKEIANSATIYRDMWLPFTLGVEKIEKKEIISYYLHSFFPFSGIAYGIRYVFNRDFMNSYPLSQIELRNRFQSLTKKDKLKILNYLGCQYYIGNQPAFNPDSAKKLSVGKLYFYVEKISNESFRPFFVFNYVRSNSVEEKLKIFLDPGFNPKQTAIIDINVKFNDKVAGKSSSSANFSKQERVNLNSIEIVEEKSGYGKYHINLYQPGIVIFPGNWAKGWKAYIDGKKTNVFPVNLFSKGMLIPSGDHEIIIRYLSTRFLLGSLISFFSIIIMAFFTLRTFFLH